MSLRTAEEVDKVVIYCFILGGLDVEGFGTDRWSGKAIDGVSSSAGFYFLTTMTKEIATRWMNWVKKAQRLRLEWHGGQGLGPIGG